MKRLLPVAVIVLSVAAVSGLCQAFPDEETVAADPSVLFGCFERQLAAIDDYTCVMTKKEVLDGREMPEDVIHVRFAKPYRLRLDWRDGKKMGMWVVYNRSEDPQRFWAKAAGWQRALGVRQYSVESKFVEILLPNRFRVPDIAFGGMIEQLWMYFLKAKELDTLDMRYGGRVPAPVSGTPSHFIHADLSPDPADGFLARSTDIYLTSDRCMPAAVFLYGWEGEEIGRYIARDIRVNVGLTDADFALTDWPEEGIPKGFARQPAGEGDGSG